METYFGYSQKKKQGHEKQKRRDADSALPAPPSTARSEKKPVDLLCENPFTSHPCAIIRIIEFARRA